MFWFTWDVVQLREIPIPADLWDYSTDSRRSFRHLETNELDSGAFPGGRGILEFGRVLIHDPFANDVGDDCGSVRYLDHENMHHNDLRGFAIRVADNLDSAYLAISTDRTFPTHHYSARIRQANNDAG
jgi:hypothetical protein